MSELTYYLIYEGIRDHTYNKGFRLQGTAMRNLCGNWCTPFINTSRNKVRLQITSRYGQNDYYEPRVSYNDPERWKWEPASNCSGCCVEMQIGDEVLVKVDHYNKLVAKRRRLCLYGTPLPLPLVLFMTRYVYP